MSDGSPGGLVSAALFIAMLACAAMWAIHESKLWHARDYGRPLRPIVIPRVLEDPQAYPPEARLQQARGRTWLGRLGSCIALFVLAQVVGL